MQSKFQIQEQEFEQKIQENLKKVENGGALTLPLAVLNGEFKKRYFHKNKFIPKVLNCGICGKRFKQHYYNQITCSKKCRGLNLAKFQKAYREKNKKSKNERMLNAWEKAR